MTVKPQYRCTHKAFSRRVGCPVTPLPYPFPFILAYDLDYGFDQTFDTHRFREIESLASSFY